MRHAAGDFDHADQQFQFRHRPDAPVSVDPGNQLVRHFCIDIAARLNRIDHEAGQSLDEEVAPLPRRLIGRLVGDKQRFGFVRTHPSVRPAHPAQFDYFLGGYPPVTCDLDRQVTEFHAHRGKAPWS